MSDAISQLSPESARHLRPRWDSFAKNGLVALALALFLAVAYYPAEVFNWPLLFTDASNMAVFAQDFLQPNFAEWDVFLDKMLETVYIALWGTVLSIVFGIPFACSPPATSHPGG